MKYQKKKKFKIEKTSSEKSKIGMIIFFIVIFVLLVLIIFLINRNGSILPFTGNTVQTGQLRATILEDTTETPSGGGGGGGAARSVSMNIIVPSTLSLEEKGEVEFSVDIENKGDVELKDISLVGSLSGDSKLINTPVVFNKTLITSLGVGKKESVLVTTFIDDTEVLFYEVVINATAKTPAYNIYNKVFINFLGRNNSNVIRIVAFTDGLINENAECTELENMLDDAKKELDAGNVEEAGKKAQAAMEACKRTIEGLEKPQTAKPKEDNTIKYIIIATVLAVVLALLFNIYRQIRFRGWNGFFKQKK